METVRHAPEAGLASRTRVSFVVDSVGYGGAEAYVGRLIEHLPERFEPSLVACVHPPQGLQEAAEAAGAPVTVVREVRSKWDLGRLARLRTALTQTRPDVIHVNLSTATNNRFALAAAVFCRVPVVVTLHVRDPSPIGIQRVILRAFFRRVSRAIAVSDEIARQLTDDLGVRAAAVTRIRNGVEPRSPMEHKDTGPMRVAALGRLTRQKGFDCLIEAVRSATTSGTSLELRIGGEGPEEDDLRRLAAGLPVELLGFVEDPDALLAGSDLYCLPSRWEGLPFSLLEAMALGLPCVATPVGDVREAIDGAGVLVEPEDVGQLADALAELAGSPERRRELGAAARKRVAERYSLAGMVEATAEVYDAVSPSSHAIDSPPRPAS